MRNFFLIMTVAFSTLFLSSACSPEDVITEETNTESTDIPEGSESSSDYSWATTSENTITLNGTSANSSSSGVSISGSKVTITKGGYYVVSGSLSDGQLVVNADTGTVRIKLNTASITNTASSPFYGKKAAKIIVFLADGTSNTLTDASTYTNTDEPNACMFSNCYMSVTGAGSLTVKGNYNDGISSDDGLVINSGTLTVTAKDDGIRGKDFLTVNGGTIGVTATTGHALKSDNETESGYGCVRIKGGTLTLSSTQKDGLHATKRVVVEDGTLTITASASQGLTADSLVNIKGGKIGVTAKEGIESFNITIAGGTTTLNATNDAINATAGTVSGGAEYNDNSSFNVTGGILVANCSNGDAIDSNGNVFMSGGTVIANGPLSGVEEGADVNGTFQMTGGIFISAGSSSNMSKSMSASSTQVNLFLKSGSAISSSTILNITDSNGNEIATFKPKNGGYYFLFSSPALTKGATYNIYTGGSYTGGSFVGGSSGYGLYTGGTYAATGATLKKTITLSTSTTVNTISF